MTGEVGNGAQGSPGRLSYPGTSQATPGHAGLETQKWHLACQNTHRACKATRPRLPAKFNPADPAPPPEALSRHMTENGAPGAQEASAPSLLAGYSGLFWQGQRGRPPFRLQQLLGPGASESLKPRGDPDSPSVMG